MSTDPFSLAGKTVLVTGASSGIGLALAKSIAHAGGKVWVTGRDEGRVAGALASLEGDGHGSFLADLTIDSQVADLVNAVPVFDGVVLNSGVSPPLRPFPMLEQSMLRDVMEVNFFGPANLIGKLIKKRKVANGGSIVFNTGTAAFIGPTATAAYSASKGALLALSKSVALDMSKKKIRSNCVAYGYVRTSLATDIISEQQLNLVPIGVAGADEVVGPVLYLLSDASRWVTRSTLIVDGGLSLKQSREP